MAQGSDAWKQRVDLENRGHDFSYYWAQTRPEMFAPSSLEAIKYRATRKLSGGTIQLEQDMFKSTLSPSKYMKMAPKRSTQTGFARTNPLPLATAYPNRQPQQQPMSRTQPLPGSTYTKPAPLPSTRLPRLGARHTQQTGPRRVEKPSAFIETMLRHKIYL